MEYFAGLDVSMARDARVCRDRDGAVIHKAKVPSTPADIAAELAKAPACRRVVFETGRMAPMLYHGLSRTWTARRLHREPAGLSGAEVARDAQDRPQRCARAGASRPHRLLQAGAREVAAGTRRPVADHRPQEAGRPAGHAGEPDPRPRRGVRRPIAAGTQLQPSSSKRSVRATAFAGLSAAMRGLVAARAAVLAAVVAIDADIKKMVRASDACRRLMTIPGVGQLTALAFTAAVDDPERFRRSRDIGAYLGLVPRRYQSGEVDYTGSISKCGDRRVRTLLYEAANVMLTRYKGPLKLKDWAFAIAKRSTMRKARIALARRLAIIMHAMLRHGTEFKPA